MQMLQTLQTSNLMRLLMNLPCMTHPPNPTQSRPGGRNSWRQVEAHGFGRPRKQKDAPHCSVSFEAANILIESY